MSNLGTDKKELPPEVLSAVETVYKYLADKGYGPTVEIADIEIVELTDEQLMRIYELSRKTRKKK